MQFYPKPVDNKGKNGIIVLYMRYKESYMQKKGSSVAESLALVLQFSINMLVPIGIMSFIGWWIGDKTGHLWVMIPFFFIGAIAGGNSIYQLSKKQLKNNKYQYPKQLKQKDAKKEEKS